MFTVALVFSSASLVLSVLHREGISIAEKWCYVLLLINTYTENLAPLS